MHVKSGINGFFGNKFSMTRLIMFIILRFDCKLNGKLPVLFIPMPKDRLINKPKIRKCVDITNSPRLDCTNNLIYVQY